MEKLHNYQLQLKLLKKEEGFQKIEDSKDVDKLLEEINELKPRIELLLNKFNKLKK